MDIPDVILSSLLIGAVYAMAAMGMGLIFGVMRVLNLAHGAFMVLGGAAAWTLAARGNIPVPWTFPIVLFLFLPAGAALWRWGLAGPGMPEDSEDGKQEILSRHLLVTIGVSLTAEDLLNRYGPAGAFALPLNGAAIRTGGVSFPACKLLLLGMVTAAFCAFGLVLSKTDSGRMVRACIQEREAACLMGVPFQRLSLMVFSLGCSLAAMAGAFYAALYPVTGHLAIPLTLKALFVVILGGMGRLSRTLAGALVLGAVEVLSGFWGRAETQAWAPYAALLLLLMVSPDGLAPLAGRLSRMLCPRRKGAKP